MRPNFEKMELIPAIVQDYMTNEVLMMAYVNNESYEYMLKNNETCFYSRSREKLWHKGKESGHIQEIKELKLDCDSDTILIKVKQTGVACHTGKMSCFFNNIIDSKECIDNTIIDKVYKQIDERAKNPKENSYTNYLLDKGIDKICKKVGEEASEVIIAAKNEDKEELINELCDLTYHSLVLMYKNNISLEEIRDNLQKRHTVEGNKKKENIKGEY